MWDAWGGTSGINWAISKLKKLQNEMSDKLTLRNAFRESRVTDSVGVMAHVSIIQAGEAKGHGVYVDEKALHSALKVAPSKIPAFLTHEGALESDRILQQVGYFQGFYIDEDRLMAKEFVALDSFKKDEPEKYNRLFDIASEIPETFGISLVFENELVWVMEDGTEIAMEDEEDPKGRKYEMPVVRFKEIYSADFVDEPACNEKGLFKALNQTHKNMEDGTKITEADEASEDKNAISEEPSTENEETLAFVAEENALAEDDAEGEEVPEADAEVEEEEVDGDNAALDLIAEVAQSVSDLSTKVEELVAIQASQGEALEKLTMLNKLGLAKKVAPKPAQTEDKPETLKERYMSLNGSELIAFTRNNRNDLLKALKVSR